MRRKMNDRRIGSGYPIVRRTTSVVAKPAVRRYPQQFSFIPNRAVNAAQAAMRAPSLLLESF